MPMIFDDDYCKLSWRDLREVMKQDETHHSQLLEDQGDGTKLGVRNRTGAARYCLNRPRP